MGDFLITAYVWDRILMKKVQGEIVKVNENNFGMEALRIKKDLEGLVNGYK